MGLSASAITLLSVLLAVLTAVLLANEYFLAALAVGVLSGVMDMLDGATARAAGAQSGYGTLLDRTADRVCEALFILGFLLSGRVPGWLALATLFALFLPSYVRAVGESAAGMDDLEVGLAGRLEKVLILAVGVGLEAFLPGFHPLSWSMALVTVLSLITALQRMVHAWKLSNGNPPTGAARP
jgi:phosphatidylglycerophosphate synthase